MFMHFQKKKVPVLVILEELVLQRNFTLWKYSDYRIPSQEEEQ